MCVCVCVCVWGAITSYRLTSYRHTIHKIAFISEKISTIMSFSLAYKRGRDINVVLLKLFLLIVSLLQFPHSVCTTHFFYFKDVINFRRQEIGWSGRPLLV